MDTHWVIDQWKRELTYISTFFVVTANKYANMYKCLLISRICSQHSLKDKKVVNMNSVAAVQLRNVSVFKNEHLILNQANFCLRRRQIYALLGPSGCGKSTLCQVIVQALKIHSGTLTLFGGDTSLAIPGKDVGKISTVFVFCWLVLRYLSEYLLNTGYMPQITCLYTYMTVSEQLNFFGKIYQIPEQSLTMRIAYWLQRLDLADYEKTPIRSMSMGQQRRVSLICALIHSPKLILL